MLFNKFLKLKVTLIKREKVWGLHSGPRRGGRRTYDIEGVFLAHFGFFMICFSRVPQFRGFLIIFFSRVVQFSVKYNKKGL